jgi:hypothetical protein
VDELGHDYLLVALGVGRLQAGIVDSYIGPAHVADEVEQRAADARQLASAARRLRDRAAADPDPLRARWLDRQLIALETLALRQSGVQMDYLDEVERCFDARPAGKPAGAYEAVHRSLDELLPAGPNLPARLEERGRRLTIPVDRLAGIADWLIGQIRSDSDRHFPAPAGEALTINLVSDQPWSAYNWYDGNLRSRIEINTDLPVRASGLIGLLTHETFPGHHLEHAWKEQHLARDLGRPEATVMLINTPESFISEGLAELGERYIVDDARWQELFAGICEQANIPLTADEPARQQLIGRAANELRTVSADAALLLHHDGRPPAEVLDFICQTGLRTREQATKVLDFIGHPLWRTYDFCYSGGEALVAGWCAAGGDMAEQRRRFFRLLTEQLTPSGLRAEVAAKS